MHSDGVSTRQSHCSGKNKNQQRSGEGREDARAPSCVHILSFVCCVLLIIYNLYHPRVPLYHTPPGREGSGLSQTDTGELAPLCLLSGDVRSRFPLPRCHHRHCHPDGARSGAKPLEESLLHREAEAEETAGPRSRVSGYFEKGCSVHGSHITFLYLWGVLFFQAPPPPSFLK